jgi:hypothetical protein
MPTSFRGTMSQLDHTHQPFQSLRVLVGLVDHSLADFGFYQINLAALVDGPVRG